MDTGKYIVLKYWVCDMCPVIFPAYLEHSDVVHRLGFELEDVDSAGFLDFASDKTIQCYGRSSSVGKEAKPERDSKLCTRLFEESW